MMNLTRSEKEKWDNRTGEFYTDLDEEIEMYLIFHTDCFEGKPYKAVSFCSEKDGEEYAEELNKQYGFGKFYVNPAI